MSRRAFIPPYATQSGARSVLSILSLLFCWAVLLFSSICHAENADDTSAKLHQLGYTEGEIVEHVMNYRVDGWNYLDDMHILLYAGPSQRFLITTMSHCPALGWAEHIGFTSNTNHLTKLDKLIMRDTGGRLQHCPIQEIRALNKLPAQ